MNTASTKDYISTLNNLIETLKDGEQGFRKAAEDVKSSNLRSVFSEYSSQRSQFASELQMEVTRLGGDAEKSGSVAGAMHRGWIDVKSAVTNRDDHNILEEAERGEDVALKSFQKALAEELPSDLRSIVEQQYRHIQQAHDRIRSLRDSTEGTQTPYSERPTRI